jgi:hypothetical protein
MKIRTLEHLEDKLFHEFAWRRDELRTINADFSPAKALVPRAKVRAGITVLYSHWEGGIKTMADAYIEYIKNQTVLYRELQPGILGLLLRGRLGELGTSSRFMRNREICEDVLQRLGESAKFPAAWSVETGSNLTAERVVDVLVSIGIESDLFATKHVLIDALVGVRNDAAHGDNIEVEKPDFLRFYEPMLEALELFRDRLIVAGNDRHYVIV